MPSTTRGRRTSCAWAIGAVGWPRPSGLVPALAGPARAARSVKLADSDDHKGLGGRDPDHRRRLAQMPPALRAAATSAHAGEAGLASASSAAFVATQGPGGRRTARGPGRQASPTSSGPWSPALAALMDEAEHDVLGLHESFPKVHRLKLHSTNPIERLHADVKRRTNGRRHLSPAEAHIASARRRHRFSSRTTSGPSQGIHDAGSHRSRRAMVSQITLYPPWQPERPGPTRREPRRAQRSYTTCRDHESMTPELATLRLGHDLMVRQVGRRTMAPALRPRAPATIHYSCSMSVRRSGAVFPSPRQCPQCRRLRGSL